MGFAAAVVDGEFSIRFVGLTGQAETHIFDQFPQVEGGEGEGEEFVGVFVNWSLALLHDHVVQVSGKYGQREFACLQVVAQLHDLVPGFIGEFSRHIKPRSGDLYRGFDTPGKGIKILATFLANRVDPARCLFSEGLSTTIGCVR